MIINNVIRGIKLGQTQELFYVLEPGVYCYTIPRSATIFEFIWFEIDRRYLYNISLDIKRCY